MSYGARTWLGTMTTVTVSTTSLTLTTPRNATGVRIQPTDANGILVRYDGTDPTAADVTTGWFVDVGAADLPSYVDHNTAEPSNLRVIRATGTDCDIVYQWYRDY